MLRWRIRRVDGRYCLFPPGEPGTILFLARKDLGTVFEGTRDYVDGICQGLQLSLGDQFLPEQLIHIQHPKPENNGSKEVDAIYAGK